MANFILAYHEHGLFTEIHVNKVQMDVMTWERDQAAALSRIAALLHHMVGIVKSHPDGKVELRHVVPGELEVREQLAGADDALSRPVRTVWGRAKKSDDKS